MAMDIDTALHELVLTRPVTEDDIVQAYRRMAIRFHPDKAADPGEKAWVQQKFVQLQEAYELLKGLPIETVNAFPNCPIHQESGGESDQQPEGHSAQGPRHEGPQPPHSSTRWTDKTRFLCVKVVLACSCFAIGLIGFPLAVLMVLHVSEPQRLSGAPAARKMAQEPNSALTTITHQEKNTSRDLSTPSSRLNGIWKTDRGEGVEYRLTEPSLKVGVFRLHHRTGEPSQWMRFKILSEEPSGDKLVVREFRPTDWAREIDTHFEWSPVSLCVPKDGRSMTREYRLFGDDMLEVYRYAEFSSAAEQRATKANHARLDASTSAAPIVEAVGISADKKPFAVVNGTMVYEGSTVNGFKIVRIQHDKVEYEKDGQVAIQVLN